MLTCGPWGDLTSTLGYGVALGVQNLTMVRFWTPSATPYPNVEVRSPHGPQVSISPASPAHRYEPHPDRRDVDHEGDDKAYRVHSRRADAGAASRPKT